jgi:uncharacterized protein (TIGR00369 family)
MSKIENNTQEQMEAYMHRTVEEKLVQQEGRINGMIAPEFVRCSLEDKTVLMRYPMQYWQTNRMEVVHGGILTTCMDNAMAILNMFLAGEYFTPTLTMETKFLRPMQFEDALLVEVTAMAVGRQISHLRAEAKSEATGKTVATATATFMTTGLAARK